MNSLKNIKASFIDLGLIDYKEAWDYQISLFESNIRIKTQNRQLQQTEHQPTDNYLIFCEHPHVYTLGKSGQQRNLLISLDALPSIGATYYHINRGGDITYHGPGQLVGYPILDLENFFTDIHKYMRLLEEAVIQTLAEFNVIGGRVPGLTGVWIDYDKVEVARKICALGVKSSRWIMMHGFALNVNNDLRYFDHIIPCGIKDKAVTSLEKELGTQPDMEKVKLLLKNKIYELFGMELI